MDVEIVTIQSIQINTNSSRKYKHCQISICTYKLLELVEDDK